MPQILLVFCLQFYLYTTGDKFFRGDNNVCILNIYSEVIGYTGEIILITMEIYQVIEDPLLAF